MYSTVGELRSIRYHIETMKLIIRLIVFTLSVLIAAYLLPGVSVESITSAFVVAVVLGVLNTFIKPILSIIALPLTVLTLGLFSFVINGLIIMAAGMLVPGFTVSNFLWAVVFAIVLGLINAFFNMIAQD